MKINVTVELDWIEEDGNINDIVQREIIDGVKNAISKDCLAMVQKKTEAAIDQGMKSAIASLDKKVGDFFDEWLTKEVVITDKYGDKVDSGSLQSLIKKRLNDCMNEKVDEKGQPGGYNCRYTRLDFVTGKKVEEVVDEYMKNYQRDIDSAVKKQIEDGIKQRVSDKFAEMVIGYAKQEHSDLKAIKGN